MRSHLIQLLQENVFKSLFISERQHVFFNCRLSSSTVSHIIYALVYEIYQNLQDIQSIEKLVCMTPISDTKVNNERNLRRNQ